MKITISLRAAVSADASSKLSFPRIVMALNKIGAAYVPIDLSFPINRIEHMLNTTKAEHLITTKDIVQNLDLNIKIIPIEYLRHNDDVNVKYSVKKMTFTILFTSGTTGIPKGVIISNNMDIWEVIFIYL